MCFCTSYSESLKEICHILTEKGFIKMNRIIKAYMMILTAYGSGQYVVNAQRPRGSEIF